MWIFKDDFNKIVDNYYDYFNVKGEQVVDYIDLKRKIKKQIKKKTNKELENLKIELTLKTSKKGTNWDNYTASRLANIAIGVSVITTLIQCYPNYIKNGQIYLIALLIFGSLFLYTFSYKNEKKEDWIIFLKLVLSCLEEILEEKNK